MAGDDPLRSLLPWRNLAAHPLPHNQITFTKSERQEKVQVRTKEAVGNLQDKKRNAPHQTAVYIYTKKAMYYCVRNLLSQDVAPSNTSKVKSFFIFSAENPEAGRRWVDHYYLILKETQQREE